MADTAVGGDLATDRSRPAAGVDRSTIQRIAVRAALEIPDVVGITRRRGLPVRLRGGRRARVRVVLDDRHVPRISMAIRIRYPAPARATAEAVRQRIADRVGAVTGLPVERVDITVTELVNDSATTA